MKTTYPTLTASDIKQHLAEIKALDKGWLDGEGESFKNFDMEAAEHFVEQLTESGSFIPYPYIFPAEEGCLSLEWDLNGWMLSFDYLPGIEKSQLHGYHPETRESVREMYGSLDLAEMKSFIKDFF